ncbi:hypothetical protein ACHHYP_06340 [Achlya hypogyna]|uniref:Leucine-rich repeat-containing protein 51 n=1 Tax=Achlya hypogyna TaxID=1202772 RepID=A0A1V9YU86_ACHHY|nr:hypothetical protein ACHHYP_06340 [Achlya hypogyna]
MEKAPLTPSPSKVAVRAATAPASPPRSPAGSPSRRAPTVKEIKAHVPDIPLDFSFMNLNSVMGMARVSRRNLRCYVDIVKEDPVSGRKRLLEDVDKPSPPKKVPTSASGDEPYTPPVSIRLNDNGITHLDDLNAALAAVFPEPSRLQWIDLSGNAITRLSPAIFASYKQLSTVHLHANRLSTYADIDSLASLPRLRQLTLHGNPVEEKRHYRNYTIFHIPSLVQLDYSTITHCDRERAETWSITYRKRLAIRRGDDVED